MNVGKVTPPFLVPPLLVRMKNLKLLQVHSGKKSTDRDSPKESGFWTYTSPTLII